MKKLNLLSLVGVTLIALVEAGWAAPHGGGGGGGFHGGGGFGGGRGAGFSGGRGGGFGGGPRGGAPHFAVPGSSGGVRNLGGPVSRSSSIGSRPFRQPVFSGGTGQSGNRSVQATKPSKQPNNVGPSGNRVGQRSPGGKPTNQGATSRGNHVFAHHDGNWHRGWDRSHPHFWHGHWCRFVGDEWIIFDTGFYPWDYYPYDYYASDYAQDYYGYDASTDPYSASIVSAVQSQLAAQGYYRGVIDGVYGPQTRAALTSYQSNHGLQATGSLTAATLQSLGLPQVTGS